MFHTVISLHRSPEPLVPPGSPAARPCMSTPLLSENLLVTLKGCARDSLNIVVRAESLATFLLALPCCSWCLQGQPSWAQGR